MINEYQIFIESILIKQENIIYVFSLIFDQPNVQSGKCFSMSVHSGKCLFSRMFIRANDHAVV